MARSTGPLPALLLACAALGCAFAFAPATNSVDATRAVRSYEAMQRTYFDPRSGGYREAPGAKAGSHAWPFSQALAAAVALANLPQTRRVGTSAAERDLVHLAGRFKTGSLYRAWPGGSVYWDDNEWIALDLLDWNAVRSEPAARRDAALVFSGVTRAWDDDAAKRCPGGVQWTDAPGNDDRNTVSTANGARLGLRLYALTHRRSYLTWSRRMLGWLERCLRAPDGLYWDKIRGNGSIDRTQWSYNQGSVIDADVLLFRLTGDNAALVGAQAIADASLARFASHWTTDEPPEFAVIFFRSLLALAAADGRAADVVAARSYGEAMWRRARNPRTGLFSSGRTPRLLDQAALVRLYALLAALPVTAGR